MLSRFRIDRGVEAGLSIDDLDVDRYEIGGELQQVLIAGRELDLDGSPNQSWQGRHLINTRGCNLVMAPVGQVQESDQPDYVQPAEITRPELYFSPSLSGYAVAKTEQNERACPGGETEEYVGTAGVQMSSFVRRAAFALAFLDYNVLGSGAIEDDSQMLWVRNVRDRLTKLAPFLSYDGDPYPVVVEGRILWVVDAYTTTSRYPYAQRIGTEVQLTRDSGLSRDSNYVRNSVKAVVDAYDGSVQFYVTDAARPDRAGLGVGVRRPVHARRADARRTAPAPPVPRGHVPRPDRHVLEVPARAGGLLRARGCLVGRPGAGRRSPRAVDGRGDVVDRPELRADAVGARLGVARRTASSRTTRCSTSASGGGPEFVLLRPFVPFSRADERTELQAYMTASSDPDTYGQLTAYVVEAAAAGRARGPSPTRSTPSRSIAQQITLQTGGGNRVRYGDLQLVPVADGLLWVRPFYAAVPQSTDRATTVTEYRFVIVAYNDRAAFGESLGEALAKLFPGFEEDLGDRVGAVEEPEDGEPPPPESGTPAESTPAELLAQADQLLADADLALEARDLAGYQENVEAAKALIDQALELLDAAAGDQRERLSSSARRARSSRKAIW